MPYVLDDPDQAPAHSVDACAGSRRLLRDFQEDDMNRTLRAAALAATATLAVALGSCRSGSRPEPSARAVGTALSTTPPAPSPFGGELALDPPVVGTVTASGAPGVASDGTGFLVGWSGGVARVSAAGGLLDAPAITVAAAGPVAFDGQSYWSLSVRNVPTGPGLSSTILSGTRLSGAGAVLDSSPILLLPGPSAGDANLAAWPAL